MMTVGDGSTTGVLVFTENQVPVNCLSASIAEDLAEDLAE